MKHSLKTMSVAQCHSERGRHRTAMGFLALERMRDNTTATRKSAIDGEVVKLRRRIARLDRQIALVSKPVEVA